MELTITRLADAFPLLVTLACTVISSVERYEGSSNHTVNRRSGRSGTAGRGAVVVGALDRVLDDVGIVGFAVVGRDVVDVVFDGTGAGRDDVGVIFTGAVGEVFAGEAGAGAAASVLRAVTGVAGAVSLANAGPADAARQSVIDADTAAMDRDLRDMSGLLDSSGVVLAHGQAA
ncbi:hypothetical protein [Amycolatopsis orientalis]|uniref:hypothetical protein n=1 Tax=Amycolatopsis orientalis TaxID=31958 RepID=UPI00055D0488|nr:hypothetical protein [Amycolatopsis orientalis]